LCAVVVLATEGWQVARAQTIVTGSVAGTVMDPSGAIIAGARVTIKNNETGAVQTAQSGANGVFRFPLLKPGTYTLTTSQQGFQTTQQAVAVRVGQTSNIRIATPFLDDRVRRAYLPILCGHIPHKSLSARRTFGAHAATTLSFPFCVASELQQTPDYFFWYPKKRISGRRFHKRNSGSFLVYLYWRRCSVRICITASGIFSHRLRNDSCGDL
jgi:Carboxypeptidase regulatory-like domain